MPKRRWHCPVSLPLLSVISDGSGGRGRGALLYPMERDISRGSSTHELSGIERVMRGRTVRSTMGLWRSKSDNFTNCNKERNILRLSFKDVYVKVNHFYTY